jgi:hypothetical protein
MPKDRHQDGWLTVENGKFYGHYNLYVTDPVTGREIRKQPMFVIGPVSKFKKWEAESILRKTVEAKVGPLQEQRMDPATTFGWFIENRFVPMKSGGWRKPTKQTNDYDINHYLIPPFGTKALGAISEYDLQVFLNGLADRGFSESVVKHCYALLKSVFKAARKQKFIDDNPAEDIFMPDTKPVKRPTTTAAYIRALYEAIEDPRDHALMCAGLFCAPRTSEAFGLTWKSYRGDHFVFTDTAWEGELYEGIMKTGASKACVYIPEEIRWSFERWRGLVLAQPGKELLSIAKCRPRVRNVSRRKDGSSGRTRTYNPPVNSRMLCH